MKLLYVTNIQQTMSFLNILYDTNNTAKITSLREFVASELNPSINLFVYNQIEALDDRIFHYIYFKLKDMLK
jgi:hypothetical protein